MSLKGWRCRNVSTGGWGLGIQAEGFEGRRCSEDKDSCPSALWRAQWKLGRVCKSGPLGQVQVRIPGQVPGRPSQTLSIPRPGGAFPGEGRGLGVCSTPPSPDSDQACPSGRSHSPRNASAPHTDHGSRSSSSSSQAGGGEPGALRGPRPIAVSAWTSELGSGSAPGPAPAGSPPTHSLCSRPASSAAPSPRTPHAARPPAPGPQPVQSRPWTAEPAFGNPRGAGPPSRQERPSRGAGKGLPQTGPRFPAPQVSESPRL